MEIMVSFQARIVLSNGQRVAVPCDVTLSWDREDDPLAVQMLIEYQHVDDGVSESVWEFSVDLLKEAVGPNASTVSATGFGDIRFQRKPTADGFGNEILVCLQNQSGHADIELPHSPVKAFASQIGPYDEGCILAALEEELEEILGE